MKFRLAHISIILILFSIQLHSQCNRQRDSVALVQLFLSSDGSNWTKNNNWHVPGQPINTWYGVILNSDGCVSELNLNSNRLKGPITDSIVNLSQLKILNLNDNLLTIGNNTDSLPRDMDKLQNLEVLNLSGNILGGPVNAALGSLSNLKTLNLSLNYFKGKLPSNLGNLSNLKKLLLNQNEISGSIPATFGQLTQLDELILSSNKMTGPIPKELGNMANLRVISLSQNQFSGSLPQELGMLSKMQFMYLNENLFSGVIPGTLGMITELRELWLNNNSITGPIPPEMVLNVKLKKLILNNNNLNGSIPDFLSALVSLSNLHLSFNNLDGVIPASISDLINLESLLLDNNNISGEIPKNIGKLTKLNNFQIHNNIISGFLPESLGNIQVLKRIYFHNNNLKGCFPESYRNFCQLNFNTNTNASGYNFLGNEELIFEGDFFQWCSTNYKVNGNFFTNAPICEGNTLLLEAEAENLFYMWQGPGGFTSTEKNPEIPDFNILYSGIYELTVTDAYGCTGSSVQAINIIGEGKVEVNTPICEGKTIILNASDGLSYEWTGPNNFSSNEKSPKISGASILNQGIYKVKIKTADCTIEKEIEVQLTTIGSIEPPDIPCEGDDLVIKASGGNFYRWTGPNNYSAATANAEIKSVTDNKTGEYTVEIRDNTGCRSILKVAIEVKKPVILDIQEFDALCSSDEKIALPVIQDGYTGSWEGKGVINNEENYFFSPKGLEGEIKLTFIPSPSITCVEKGLTNIFVHKVIVTGFENTPNNTKENKNGSFLVNASGSGNSFTYIWEGPVSGEKKTNDLNPFYIEDIPSGIYFITLTNESGCKDLDSFEVRNFYSEVLIPNVVRKSSPLRSNTLYTIYGENIISYDIEVYNRWGNLDYSATNVMANDEQNGWDLSLSSLQTGVYVIVLNVHLPKGKETRIENLTILE
jgi:Leucine-rich repeat (LRR) protein